MGMLADWYVQLSTKGKEKVEKDIDDAGKALDKAKEKAKKFEETLNTAFLVATGGITAFVMKGLSGTEQGERMAAAFQVLAETIASIFLPAVEMLTAGLIKLAGWLDKLGTEGQFAILAFGTAVATAMAIATGGITAIITAIAGLAGMIGLVTTRVKGAEMKRVSPLQQAPAFEKSEDTFKRIQTGIMGGTTQEQILRETRNQVQATRDVEKAVRRTNPAVG